MATEEKRISGQIQPGIDFSTLCLKTALKNNHVAAIVAVHEQSLRAYLSISVATHQARQKVATQHCRRLYILHCKKRLEPIFTDNKLQKMIFSTAFSWIVGW